MKQLIKIQKNADGKKAVSAREMYLGLGLQESNWQRWANKNIEKNPFAIEGVDWLGFDLNVESYSSLGRVKKGNRAKDYILTLDFAKKLCMQARTEKGEEIRDYFLEVEKKANTPQIIDNAKLQEIEAKINRLEAITAQTDISEFSVIGYASFCRKKIYGREAMVIGKQATKKCKELDLPIGQIRDARFGVVNTYPESVLKQVFEEFFKQPRF